MAKNITCCHCQNDDPSLIEDITTTPDPKQPEKRVYLCSVCSHVFKA